MELYLQFAYGMKQIAIDLSRDWTVSYTHLTLPTKLEV